MTTTPHMRPDQAYDIELESLLDNEATCALDDKPATHLFTHGGKCPTLLCSGHAKAASVNAAKADAGECSLHCTECDGHQIAPSSIQIRNV